MIPNSEARGLLAPDAVRPEAEGSKSSKFWMLSKVWSLDGACTHVLNKHLGAVTAARFSPDGARIVTAGRPALRGASMGCQA